MTFAASSRTSVSDPDPVRAVRDVGGRPTLEPTGTAVGSQHARQRSGDEPRHQEGPPGPVQRPCRTVRPRRRPTAFPHGGGEGETRRPPTSTARWSRRSTRPSYTVRALAKNELGRAQTVGPPKGLWYADDLRVFSTRDKDSWRWTTMIVQPEWATDEKMSISAESLAAKKPHVAAARSDHRTNA